MHGHVRQRVEMRSFVGGAGNWLTLARPWHSSPRFSRINYRYYCKLLLFFSAKFHCMERVVEYWRESPSRFFLFRPAVWLQLESAIACKLFSIFNHSFQRSATKLTCHTRMGDSILIWFLYCLLDCHSCWNWSTNCAMDVHTRMIIMAHFAVYLQTKTAGSKWPFAIFTEESLVRHKSLSVFTEKPPHLWVIHWGSMFRIGSDI